MADTKVLLYIKNYRFFKLAFNNNIRLMMEIAANFIQEVTEIVDEIYTDFVELFS